MLAEGSVGLGEVVGISAVATTAIGGAYALLAKFIAGKRPHDTTRLPCQQHGESIAALKTQFEQTDKRLDRMDKKLDRLLEAKAS